MDEGGAAAGLIGILLVAMRIIERSVDKKNGSSGTSRLDTRMALAEQQMNELRETMLELKDKVVENLKLSYELKNELRIHQEVEKVRREANGTNDPTRRDQ
tara:strand:+ start:257 stop:559 length:303 start_codon:yes stop_codon:yes gene_type:complete